MNYKEGLYKLLYVTKKRFKHNTLTNKDDINISWPITHWLLWQDIQDFNRLGCKAERLANTKELCQKIIIVKVVGGKNLSNIIKRNYKLRFSCSMQLSIHGVNDVFMIIIFKKKNRCKFIIYEFIKFTWWKPYLNKYFKIMLSKLCFFH